MSDIVERLRGYANDDHERGCQGRYYVCSCGYDGKRDPLLTDAADEITRLRAATQWRPIESAPKDGRQFLVWDIHYGVRIGRAHIRADHDDWLSYMDAHKGSSKGGIRATHWQPLPPPPAINQEGAE